MQRQRISKAVPAVDTISRLPDEILCHILSLVTTKEAVATSILSNRWIHLWHHVPNINFTITLGGTIQSILSFNKFVNSVLASRDAAGSHFINTFHLKIISHQNRNVIRLGCPSITEWVNLVVQHRLEYLFLHLYIPCIPFDALLPNLPISIFTCTTLVSLDLRWFSVKGFSFSSVGFGFPSLKTLRLDIIKFSEVRDLMLLIAGCPIFEDLLLSNIKFRGEEDPLTIQHEFKSLSLPKLTRADITKCWCYFPMKALSNTGYLCIDKFNRKVYEVNQLRCLSNDVPIFHNLTHLKLINNWNLVVQVLHRCPKLQNLELLKRWNGEENDQEGWVEPEFVPQCLSSYKVSLCSQHIF